MSGHVPSPIPRPTPRERNGSRPSYSAIRRMPPVSNKLVAGGTSSSQLAAHQHSSSADSEVEVIVDRSFAEMPHPMPSFDRRGRGKRRDKSASKSRGQSLDNLLTFAGNSVHSDNSYEYDMHQNRLNAVDSTGVSVTSQWPHSQDHQYYDLDSGNPHSHHRRSRTEESQNGPDQKHRNSQNTGDVYELQMRIAQMEKTLRWWSDCTANWREKWTKVRSERNRARDELKKTRATLETNAKEINVLREQKSVLVKENLILKQQLSNKVNEISFSEDSCSISETPRLPQDPDSNVVFQESHAAEKLRQKDTKTNASGSNGSAAVDEDQLTQKLAALQLRVDESVKTIQAERNSKLGLHKTIESLEQELASYKQKFEEVKDAKQDILKQLARVQESHQAELSRINQNLEEEMVNRSQMEKKLHDLREEIERLQEENTSEWGKRERLETEKLQLERENKRLKTNCDELKAEMERRRKTSAEDRDNELRQAHSQLRDLNEELSNLRRQCAKDQKLLEDRQEELAHSKRRAEQHEAEVRSLRMRVEEIKKLQTTTEDELDNSQNQTRKLTRVLEEKDEELEKLHLQLDQMQTRIRREQSATPSWSKPSSFSRRDAGDNANLSSDSCSDI